MRLLGNELSWLAEDCLQDIILAAFERRNSFVDSDQWHAWILTSIRNHTVDIMRKSLSSKKYSRLLLSNDDIHDAVEADIIEQETMNALFEAINSLPKIYREIVEMSFVQGLKNTEIASMLNITEVAVRKRKAHLIEILRDKLGNTLDTSTIILLLGNSIIAHMLKSA